MIVPDRKDLLARLDQLDYRERLGHIARLAHEARHETALDDLLDELEDGDVDEKAIALWAAHVAGRTERLRRALTSDSALVRRVACLFGLSAGATDLEALLPEVAPWVRRRLIAKVASGHRTRVADALLPFVLDRFGAREAAPLLRPASPPTVRRFLPEIAHALTGWRRLAATHVDPVLDYVRELAPGSRDWRRAQAALPVLAAERPAETLELAHQLLAAGRLPERFNDQLAILARRIPDEVARFLLHADYRARLLQRGVPRSALRELRRLPDPAIRELARVLVEKPASLTQLLAALPPSQRGDVFAHATAGVDTSRRLWPDALLEALPHAARDAEAQRMLSLRAVREDSAKTLRTTAFRDVDEARPVLEEAARASKAADRANALALLVRCTGRSRRGLAESLALLRRSRNDQDGVRSAFLAAVAELSPTLFADEHVEALSALADDAFDARDTSWSTKHQLQNLANRLVRFHAGEPHGAVFRFGVDLLRRLDEDDRHLNVPALHDLPRGVENEIYAAFEPQLAVDLKRGQDQSAITLAHSFGDRGWKIEGLQERLWKATANKERWTAQQAAGLWLADPRTRDERTRRLLDRDPSAINLGVVFEYLHRRRQTWLDPFLEGRPLEGRFEGDSQPYVPGLDPPVRSGFHRWPAGRQRALLEQLDRVIRGQGRRLTERLSAMVTMARLPIVSPARLGSFLEGDQIPLAEAALASVVRTDRTGEAIPVLLEHLDSDRARVAMYALPRCARLAAPARMLEVLSDLLGRQGSKITVRKEAVRLLGGLRGSGGLMDLDDGVVWEGALGALIAAARFTGQGETLLSVVHALRTAPIPQEHDAAADRDLPARRRLRHVCVGLRGFDVTEREQLRPVLRRIAAELSQDVTWLPDAAQIEVGLVDWSDPRSAAQILNRLAKDADREPFLQSHLTQAVKAALNEQQFSWAAAEAEALLAALDASSLTARHLELAVLEAVAGRESWTEPWTSRLRTLRRHPDAGLRWAALEVSTQRESGGVSYSSGDIDADLDALLMDLEMGLG